MINTMTYEMAQNSLEKSDKALQNAKSWKKGYSYEQGDVVIFNNSFYSANYANDLNYFEHEAWTKINNSADKLKGYTVDTTNKGNGQALIFDEDENKIKFGIPKSNIEADTDVELSADSDERVPSQKAVKSYVDNKVKNITTGMNYKGAIDISNNPLPSDIKVGDFYKVIGSKTIDKIQLNADDMIIANKTKEGISNMSDWDIIDNTNIPDVLKQSDISNDIDLSIDSGKLTDRGTIKKYIDEINGDEILQTETKTLKGAINELFKDGVDVKENVVTALTSKGQSVTIKDKWAELISAIYSIQTGDGSAEITRITKLNIEASSSNPYTKIITLKNPIQNKEVLTCVREFIRGTDETNLISDFNNNDGEHFIYDKDKIIFDGVLRQNRQAIKEMTFEKELETKKEYNYKNLKGLEKEYNSLDGISYSNDGDKHNLVLDVTHKPQSVMANGDIILDHVDELKQIIFNCISTNGGKCLLAMSVDSGQNYYGYDLANHSWTKIDVNNTIDFKNKGMSKTIVDTLTSNELEDLRKGSNKLRFAYYIELQDGNSEAKVDSLSIVVSMNGHESIANKNDYDIVIDETKNNVSFKIYKNGTFSMSVVN